MTDIEKYINFVTKPKGKGKRAITQLSANEITADLRQSSYLILSQLATQIPELKGRDLTGFIQSMMFLPHCQKFYFRFGRVIFCIQS